MLENQSDDLFPVRVVQEVDRVERIEARVHAPETVGKAAVIRKSEIFQGNNTIESQDLRGPFFCGAADASSGRFAVYTAIGFTPKAGGARAKHEEVGLYSVKNDIVTREEFFYEGRFI